MQSVYLNLLSVAGLVRLYHILFYDEDVIFFQNLIDLICDVESMEDAVKEMKYDAKKAPLGKKYLS